MHCIYRVSLNSYLLLGHKYRRVNIIKDVVWALFLCCIFMQNVRKERVFCCINCFKVSILCPLFRLFVVFAVQPSVFSIISCSITRNVTLVVGNVCSDCLLLKTRWMRVKKKEEKTCCAWLSLWKVKVAVS